jgi:hypothetical protein
MQFLGVEAVVFHNVIRRTGYSFGTQNFTYKHMLRIMVRLQSQFQVLSMALLKQAFGRFFF